MSNIVKTLLEAGAKTDLTTKELSILESTDNQEREAEIALFKEKYAGTYVNVNTGKPSCHMSVSAAGEVWIKNPGCHQKAPIEKVLNMDGTLNYSFKVYVCVCVCMQ